MIEPYFRVEMSIRILKVGVDVLRLFSVGFILSSIGCVYFFFLRRAFFALLLLLLLWMV